MSIAKRHGRKIVGGLLGAALGYAWYRVVGCSTGTCALSANPWTATLLPAVLGVLVAGDAPPSGRGRRTATDNTITQGAKRREQP
jgi:hypothetical protein